MCEERLGECLVQLAHSRPEVVKVKYVHGWSDVIDEAEVLDNDLKDLVKAVIGVWVVLFLGIGENI